MQLDSSFLYIATIHVHTKIPLKRDCLFEFVLVYLVPQCRLSSLMMLTLYTTFEVFGLLFSDVANVISIQNAFHSVKFGVTDRSRYLNC